MIVDYWPTWFRELVFSRGKWPDSYCCVDVETSGYSFASDVVTEWGHCLVEDGKVIDQLSLVIDWSDRHVPPEYWLETRLQQVRQGMELAGKRCHMSFERMKAEGMRPEKAFPFIQKFTKTVHDKGIPFVGHNFTFDEKMLSANFLQFKFGPGYSFGDRVIDTDGIEKASQIADNERVHPRKSDTLRDYFHRVRYTRVTGLKSNMDEHCYAKYKFKEKYGIKQSELHGARMDSYCCHLLMQEFAAQITEPQTPPVYPTADSQASRRTERPQPQVRPTLNLKRIRGVRRS